MNPSKHIKKRWQRRLYRYLTHDVFEGRSALLDRIIFRFFGVINAIGKRISPELLKDIIYQRLLHYLLKSQPYDDTPLQSISGTSVEEAIFLVYKKKRFMEVAQPGDVILVRGNMRISRVIQTLTHSSYSHAALYMGQGELIEAEPEGVLLSSIDKYLAMDVRICRPVLLSDQGVQIVLEHARHMLREQPQYDVKNIESLLFKYVYKKFRPDVKAYIGGTTRFEKYYICSGLIAHGFHKAGYPIVPSLRFRKKRSHTIPELETIKDYFTWVSHGHKNFSQIVPADFDNSSFFATVKFLCQNGIPRRHHKILIGVENAEEPSVDTPPQQKSEEDSSGDHVQDSA
ncbi:MAG: hypothetical protein HQM12_03995 [SAR324 cluster bacterium]|nr:hypothetical protein [SAR324 cluster bacterium]